MIPRIPRKSPMFICTGDISDDDYINYQKMVKDLGGKILNCKNDQFMSTCTHVLIFSFNSSVKILGGLASGKWLLNKEYVTKSSEKGKWLNEEDFELKDFMKIAKFHRLREGKLYEGLRFYLETDNASHSRSLIRVLSAGGATIYNKKDISDGCAVDLALTNVAMLEVVKSFIGETVPILDIDYIKATIFSKHPPLNIKKYILNKSTAIIKSKFTKKKGTVNIPSSVVTANPLTPRPHRVIIKKESNESNEHKRCISNYFTVEASDKKKMSILSDTSNDDDVEILAEVGARESELDKNKSVVEDEIGTKMKSEETSSVHLEDDSCKEDESHMSSLHESSSKCTDSCKEDESHNAVESSNAHILKSTECLPKSQEEIKTSKSSHEISKNLILESNLKKITSGKRVVVPVNFDRMSKIVSIFLRNMNTSQCYLNSFHIPAYDYPEIGDVRELDHSDSVFSEIDFCEEKIVKKRVGRHMIYVTEVNEDQGDFTDLKFICESLQYMRLKIQPDIVPFIDDVGVMLKFHVLKSLSRVSADMALNIFKSLIRLHPPHNIKMRNYYWNIFQNSMPEKVSSSRFIGWNFVVLFLEDLLKVDKEELKYDVVFMVDTFLQLFELDLVQYNERPISVTSLLSYRLFWGLCQNPSIINKEVKDLIQMWIRASTEDYLVLGKITRFLCLMFEMLWKWSDIDDFFALSTWPLHCSFMPLANEFLLHFKDVSVETLLKLVKLIRVPWQRLYLGSLAYRSKIIPSEFDVQLSFPYLKSKLCEECTLCSEEEKNKEFPHELRIKFLTLLTVSYAQAMGVKFCKTELIRDFDICIKTKHVICPTDEEINDAYSAVEHRKALASTSEDKTANESSEINNNNDSDNFESGQQSNTVVRKVVINVMRLFMNMSNYINDLNAAKVNCVHISDFNFSNAL